MIFRIVGAALIIAACGGFGFMLSAAHKKEVGALVNFINALDTMECELLYKQTALPELCREIAQMQTGSVSDMFSLLAEELNSQIRPNVASCIHAATKQADRISPIVTEAFISLGNSLGRYDMEGQLLEIRALRTEMHKKLDQLRQNQNIRIKNYRTLGVCAGIALVILFF